MFDRPADRQLTLFADAPVATTPEPADVELTEDTMASIRAMWQRGVMAGTICRMFGISSRQLVAIVHRDPPDDVGPSDAELDAIFGEHTRPPRTAPGGRGDVATSVESKGERNALNVM